jgi:hypothetical protein
MSHGSRETAQSILKEYRNLMKLREKVKERFKNEVLCDVEDPEAH